jgi:NADH-quinone oxidoreductase subunit A
VSEPARACLRPPSVQAGLTDPATVTYAPILMVFAFAALVAGALLFIPTLIAPRRLTPVKSAPFECGKDPIAVTEGRFAIKFSLIAILFIIIDIELLFIWPWATLFRQLGWFGFVEMLVFLGILMLGFAYVWRKGGLEWE